LYPFGHCCAQPIAGQAMPLPTEPLPPCGGGTGGGTQPPFGSQLHAQGGQACPGGQDGQPHAQPPPPGGGGVIAWHTPETQVWPLAGHGAPSANQWHWSAVSATQLC
jgi:hypothetical protein